MASSSISAFFTMNIKKVIGIKYVYIFKCIINELII